jgi:7,8-dihydroneopterin aldolase/epimerase/oxygenase
MPLIKQKVALEGIRFYAYHGFYPEEQKIGNEFFIDLETEMTVEENLSDELSKTVNYERLFEIVSKEMQTPRKLLETVAHYILKEVIREFDFLDAATIRIKKQNLPVKGEVKNSLIELTYSK